VIEMSEEKKTPPKQEEVKQSFVTEQKTTPPVATTIPEMLTKIYDCELYVGALVKQLNSVVEQLNETANKMFEFQKETYKSVPKATPVQAQVPVPERPTPTAPATTATPTSDEKLVKLEDSLKEFKDRLSFEADSNNMFYIIRTKSFLGSDNFGKIAQVVRGLGGEYVSAGKASHFRVPKSV
jgi:hypothetical protein